MHANIIVRLIVFMQLHLCLFHFVAWILRERRLSKLTHYHGALDS